MGWVAQVQSRVSEGWRFFFTPLSVPLQRTHIQRPLLKMSPTARDETSRGRNPENGRHRDFGRRRHRESGFQHTDRPRPSSPELFNKDYLKLIRIFSSSFFCISWLWARWPRFDTGCRRGGDFYWLLCVQMAWGPLSLLQNEYQGLYLGVKAAECRTSHLASS